MKLSMTKEHWWNGAEWIPCRICYERYGDWQEHNHDLDHMNLLKRNNGLRTLVGGEVANGYMPHQIYRNLRNCPEAEAVLIAAGGRYLQRQDIVNAGLAFRRANPDTRLVGNSCFSEEEQWADVAEWLEHAGYLVSNIVAIRHSDKKPSRGTVWAEPPYLNVLAERGHLTIMDSTHETNWLGWFLYTMSVRDGTGCWRPCGHLLAEFEDSDILAAGMKVLKQWAEGVTSDLQGWRLRYMITDDSAAEQRAVQLAFPGLHAGERVVTHLLCTFHSEQTLKRRLKGSSCAKSLRHLTAALKWRKTGPGVEESIQNAIHSAPNPAIAKYIENEWWKTRKD